MITTSESSEDAAARPIAQAGTITVDLGSSTPRFLLVRAKQTPDEWIFPKGHVEPEESGPDAALRELREEAGVDARILGPIGHTEYSTPAGTVHVEYYLAVAIGRVGPGDGRDCQWQPAGEARQLLAHADARRLLDRATALLEQ